jgi:hypothetical protein
MNVIRRLAQASPEKLVDEIVKLRADRDNLRDALALKLVDYARTLNISGQDILIVKRPEKMSPDLLLEVVEKVGFVLQTRYSWGGVVLIGSETEGLDKLGEADRKKVYLLLKECYEGPVKPAEPQVGDSKGEQNAQH